MSGDDKDEWLELGRRLAEACPSKYREAVACLRLIVPAQERITAFARALEPPEDEHFLA
jgi:hypothetical protein